MTDDDLTRQSELDEDESRIQVVSRRSVRKYLRKRSRDNGRTYSQEVDAWLPENPGSRTFEFTDRDVVDIKFAPLVHGKLDMMAGQRVSPGDVLAYYALKDALQNDDYKAASEIIHQIPDILWDEMEMEALRNDV